MSELWWVFLLIIAGAAVFVFSRAEECYECGKRGPDVYSHGKTRALCNSCWVGHQDHSDT